MTATPDIQNSTIDALNNIHFSDLFILEDLQRLQDLFADAHGVASIITDTDGRPITRPSNFCRLCNDIIRKTEKRRANCFKSNAVLGRYDPSGPIVQPCLSGGLWNAGASITVGGKHIANWIISQVRNEEVDEQRIIQYGDVIGANREDFRKALNEVPVMSVEQFNKVAKMLFAFANELSEKAYNNLLLKMQIAERVKATELLQKNEERFQLLFNKAPLGYQSLDFDGNFIEVNQQWLDILGYTREEVIGKWFGDYLSPVYQDGFHERFPIFKAQGTIHSEFEMVHKNGDKLFIAFEGKIGYDFNGEFKQTHCILQDITDRKQAEESLRESRQILEEIINTIPFRVFWKDKDLTYLGCNTLFARDAGFGKPEDVIGKDDYAMGWREQAELYRADDRLVIGSGRPKLLIEEPQTAPTGEQTCLLTSKVPLKDQTGKIAGVLGTYLDITERKLTEDALRESESQLSETQSVAKVGSWTTDLKNLKVRWSKELYRIFEIDPDSFQSSHQAFLEFVHPEDRAIVDAAFVLSFDNHSVNTIEHQILTPGGKIKFVEEYWKIISDHQGKPIRAVGSCQDITERKRTEEALRKSEAVQGKMVANIGDVIVIIDQDGINRYKSPNIEKWFGWNPEEVIGKSTWENIHPEDLGSTQKIFGALLGEPNATGTMECRYRCKDRSYKWIEFTGVNLLHDPDIRGLLGNYHDITERKLAEQELIVANKELAFQNEEKEKRAAELIIAKEHAEESDKLKTAFINNISHEIRTPFNGILGFLSILEDNNLTKSERDEYTSIINKSAYRLMNTINDIVEISQIQAGQMKLTASETNIKRLTNELFDLFKTDAKSQGLEFTITNDLPNNIESVSTDGVKLKTILSILIGNAIKFTKAGSIEFGIKCKDKVEDCRDTACRVPTTCGVPTACRVTIPVEIEFSIKDTGVGISGNKQKAIFDQFMQADVSNTRQFEGSGLGLSIAKAYVEMLGGKIWVESDPKGKSGGKGSVFYFTIPYNEEQEE